MAVVHPGADTSWKRLLWFVLAGFRGGPNPGKIINPIRTEPRNLHQLAEALHVHYPVAEHHIRALEKNHIIISSGERYGRLYFLSPELEAHMNIFDEIWNKIQPTSAEMKRQE